MVEIQLRGRKFVATPADIKNIAKHLPTSRGRKYVTIVDDKVYAPKELVDRLLMEKKLPLTRVDFTTMDAVRILRRLGFDTVPLKESRKEKRTLSSFAGMISLGGDSVKEGDLWYE